MKNLESKKAELLEIIENNYINDDCTQISDMAGELNLEDVYDILGVGSTQEIVESDRVTILGYSLNEDTLSLEVRIEQVKTYDVQFDSDTDSNSKGFMLTFDECLDYIKENNTGINRGSYFEDYKGGTVSIVLNEAETPEEGYVYSEEVK